MPCAECGDTSISENETITHIETVHKSQDSKLHSCNSSQDELSEPDINADKSNACTATFHPCDYCGNLFTSADHLSEHMETVHATEYLTCNACKYRCKTKHHLKSHIEESHIQNTRGNPESQIPSSATSGFPSGLASSSLKSSASAPSPKAPPTSASGLASSSLKSTPANHEAL